ncbi:fatty acid synthase-like [Cydia pomonella]|uniref:fatty acid synthase-like n=1 Tax=Cydia pomonella TaxID=82600 RepID=UPI002ADD4917|nr:fatty acid synthase-like [Cydia pomonella]
MAPTPQEIPRVVDETPKLHPRDDGDRVVISGVSGVYPGTRHIKEFSEMLYNKVDPIAETKPRWDYMHPEVPDHVGIIPGVDQFDGQFFRVAYRMGFYMDPMSRKMLEHVYQAIYDAGVNPEYLSGKKVGVYMGTSLSESEKVIFYYGPEERTGLGIVGFNKSMFANRVSYWLNAKGPSMSIDGGCCSSAVALDQAYHAMTRGDCEAAVVGGCNLCLHPQTSILLGRSIPLCKDGKTKSYDQSADGCVRSEAINVLFLQKAKDARRIYAEVVNTKANYISFKNAESWKREKEEVTGFLKEFYDEIKISPQDVEYVEGFGAADPNTDKTELEVFDDIFCGNRDQPLYVGSVMSNVGYTESATGIAAVTKVLLGYHTGHLAGTLHCSQPRGDVAALREDRIRILCDHRPTARSYIAVNGLSVSGINSHVLLHGHYKPKDLTKYQCSIPRLVLLSSRTDSGVQNVINQLKSQPIDAEELALIHNIHSSKVNGHLGRGFAILDTDKESKTTSLIEKAEYFDGASRPLWFVYSGMGSQWPGMGTQLMRIPIFAAAIERCRQVLEPKGIDVVHIITSPDKTIFDNIIHSFVGITAVQIGLTDILLELGLVPEKIIGHSMGELGCAYADGCMTAEEVILAAYGRGLVSKQTPFIRGSMAAVGIGYEQVSKMCPPEIEVACHNAANSSTISGPAEVMSRFVAELTAKEIFAKEVPCSNIAYHSRYIAEAGPGLLKYLKEVIKTPKLRGERWLSTSVPQAKWDEEIAKYSSAEYHTNNLLSPVLFEETSRLIPKDAVLVEVAPHGLLQAILKRAQPSCANVPLTRRGHPDNARFLLEALGHLFMEGYYPDIRVLYPKVEFPVSTGTPHLSHLVEWAHQEQWPYPMYLSAVRKESSTCTFMISLHDDEHLYLRGHRIGGKTLFPFAAALVCAWDTLAMSARVPRHGVSVKFSDVVLYSQPTLHDSRLLRLTVALQRGNGRFEIDDGITKVASGYVVLDEIKKSAENEEIQENQDSKEDIILIEKEEIYQILNENGYMYQDEFRSIRQMRGSLTGVVSWTRWETFIDSLFQLHALRRRNARAEPAFIREIIIDTDAHAKAIQDKELKAQVCVVDDYTRCGGVTLTGIKFNPIVKNNEDSLVLDTSKFDVYPVVNVSNGIENGGKTDNGKVLRIAKIGDLESLHWADAPALEDDGIPVTVNFAGLNASDILKANQPREDTHSPQDAYGMDFSGTTEDGARVMGLARGTARSTLRTRPELLWPVPEHWTLEDGATVPFAYAHALYCLAIKSPLLRGSSILVSGGAGATGQAIVAMALHFGCRVFAVVDDSRKKNFLLKMFPKLITDNIICCRDDSFLNRVLLATNGQGCDTVICGSGDQKDAYIQCCAPLGVTLDIHRVKRNENFNFKLYALNFDRSYMSVDFSSLFLYQDIGTFQRLQQALAEGISAGWVRPLSRACYAACEGVRAFRLLARGAHRGRVLLRVHDAEPRTDTSAGWVRPLSRACYAACEGVRAFRLLARGAHRGRVLLRVHDAEPRTDTSAGWVRPLSRACYAACEGVRAFRLLARGAHRGRVLLRGGQQALAEGISAGWVRPLSRACYAACEGVRAFRLLARGAHRGRVLLRVHDAEPRTDTRLLCSGRYLIVGDSSRLTICLAERLVRGGARALHVRLAHTEPLGRLQELRKSGVKITISSEDLAHHDCASNLLKKSSAMGTVEGVFVVMAEPLTDQTRSIYRTLLTNLDVRSRKMSPFIKFFTVIGINNSLGEQVCVSRAADGLPAMMLSVSIDRKISDTLLASYVDIVNAMERGLKTMQPVVFAQYPPEESLSKQIEKITGVTISGNTCNSQTLQDLGITRDKTQALHVFLKTKQNITISEDDVSSLSVEKLREIVGTLEESDYVPMEGLSAFFPFVDSDELVAVVNTVVMPTLTQASNMRDDEFNASGACLYIVPGMQGLHQRYRALCERLQLAAVVLQPGLDHPEESLQEMTTRYVTMFLKQKSETNKFYLLGHELGVLSVFEIAAALEDRGMTGTVFCLGGGPGEFLSELERQLRVACAGQTSEAALQDAVARHMCALMGIASPELDAALCQARTWALKIDVSMRALRGRVAHSMQYARLLMESAYSRVTQAKRARLLPRALRSRIVLLRSPAAPSLDLQRWSLQPLVVHELQAPFVHAADDLRAAPIINRYLDEETIQCFAKKTLCHTYLLNAQCYFKNSVTGTS